MTIPDASHAGTFLLGGEIPIHRLGFGAMRVTGPGIWGEPDDREACLETVRRVPELGMNFIDTADSYGPAISEPMLREALHPYPNGLVIATKGGQVRPGPEKWIPVGRPDYLLQQVKMTCAGWASSKSRCGNCTASPCAARSISAINSVASAECTGPTQLLDVFTMCIYSWSWSSLGQKPNAPRT